MTQMIRAGEWREEVYAKAQRKRRRKDLVHAAEPPCHSSASQSAGKFDLPAAQRATPLRLGSLCAIA
jgi:hypothetical protein